MALYSSKKGMSPLIATVLLIAFAVAIGAMIMNWSAGVEEGAHDKGHGSPDACGDVNLASDGSVCYGNNKIAFEAKNIGSHRIDAVKLDISSESTDYEIKVKDSALIGEESTSREVPYAHTGGDTEVNFVPMVKIEGELKQCKDSGFVETLSEC